MNTMIRTLLYISLVSSLALGSSSCSDFLETNPSASVSDQEVFKTVQGAQAALNGCYRDLRAYNSGGASRWDDCGIPSNQMVFDACGLDMIAWGGWYVYDYSFWGHTRGDIFKTSQFWTFHYRLINNLNSIIAYIDNAEGADAEKTAIKGQAKALRGWAYFGLIRLFQHTYSIAKDMPGVPLYTEPTTDKTEGKPRGTVEQVYSFIETELKESVDLLEGYSRGDRINTFNQEVVKGILAEVYLTMNKWNEAANLAKEAREGYPLMDKDQFQAGFNDETNPEWMWGLMQTKDQNWGDYSPFAMWSNGTRKCYTFQCLFLNDKFVESFDADDVRSQFEWWWDMIHVSYKFRDNEACIGSMVVMRAAEMYLIEAEALARQAGKEGLAKNVLWELQDMRNAVRTQSSGEQLIEDILMERRKELYGEGFAWFDLIRNQKPIDRKGNHMEKPYIPARSWRFVYQIPNNEMNNNKSLKQGIWPAGDQNPFDGIYQPK